MYVCTLNTRPSTYVCTASASQIRMAYLCPGIVVQRLISEAESLEYIFVNILINAHLPVY